MAGIVICFIIIAIGTHFRNKQFDRIVDEVMKELDSEIDRTIDETLNGRDSS